MVIRASSHREIEALVTDLASGRSALRDAAVARLTIIGARAVERLVHAARDRHWSADGRRAALLALGAIGDRRAIEPLLEAMDDGEPAVASAAVTAAGSFLRDRRGVAIVDRMTGLALDAGRPPEVRLTALQLLNTLPKATVAPVFQALQSDPDRSIAGLAAEQAASADADDTSTWPEMLESGSLPPDPIRVRQALAAAAERMPLPALHRLVDEIRRREDHSAGREQKEWQAVRGAVHAALAAKDSRLAVYDLRETLAAADEPLPVEMISALAAVGDASCLEPMAAAYAKVTDAWWRRQLLDACRAIMARERLTTRHAVVRKIVERWPRAAPLWRAARPRPRPRQ